MHILRLLVIGCATAIALSACGSSAKSGDNGAASTTTVTADPRSAPTKAEYIKNADAACALYQQRITDTADRIPSNVSPELIEQAERRLIMPLQLEQLWALQALTPPVDDGAQLNEIWAQAAEAMDSQNFEDVNADLTAYGFTKCAF